MIIPINRERVPILLLVGLLLLVVFIFLLIDPLTHFNDKGYGNSLYLGVLGGATVGFFNLTILSALEYIKTLFDKSASMTITDKGIMDNLSIFSVGEISWAEITDIKVLTYLRTKFLVICVTNPQSLIDRKSRFKRRTLKGFMKKFGSPIVVSQKRVNTDIDELKNIIINSKPKLNT